MNARQRRVRRRAAAREGWLALVVEPAWDRELRWLVADVDEGVVDDVTRRWSRQHRPPAGGRQRVGRCATRVPRRSRRVGWVDYEAEAVGWRYMLVPPGAETLEQFTEAHGLRDGVPFLVRFSNYEVWRTYYGDYDSTFDFEVVRSAEGTSAGSSA